jgi:hypothetical protein
MGVSKQLHIATWNIKGLYSTERENYEINLHFYYFNKFTD